MNTQADVNTMVRNLDRHGPGWESVREAVDAEQGWPLYLERYRELFTSR